MDLDIQPTAPKGSPRSTPSPRASASFRRERTKEEVMAAKTLQYFIRVKMFGEKKVGFADVVLNMLNNSRAWNRVQQKQNEDRAAKMRAKNDRKRLTTITPKTSTGLEQDYEQEIGLLDSNHAMQRALRKASMDRHGKAHQIMLESVSKDAERRERQSREAAMRRRFFEKKAKRDMEREKMHEDSQQRLKALRRLKRRAKPHADMTELCHESARAKAERIKARRNFNNNWARKEYEARRNTRKLKIRLKKVKNPMQGETSPSPQLLQEAMLREERRLFLLNQRQQAMRGNEMELKELRAATTKLVRKLSVSKEAMRLQFTMERQKKVEDRALAMTEEQKNLAKLADEAEIGIDVNLSPGAKYFSQWNEKRKTDYSMSPTALFQKVAQPTSLSAR